MEYMLPWMKTCNRFSMQFKLCPRIRTLKGEIFYRVCNLNWLLKLVSNIGSFKYE